MNYITIDGELVTPKTEAMAYEQTNHRMDTLEQNIQNDFAGVRQEITETVNSIGNEMEVLSDRINSDISSVEGRIDNIIAHNNDTEGNSELVDIRTGVDGTVYASAGTAVREQINDINDNLDDYFNFPNNIINFRTAQFADRANAGIILNVLTKNSFTISIGTTPPIVAVNKFCGFVLNDLISGHNYTVDFSFADGSTFPESLPYYISVVTNTDLSGETLGRSDNVQTGKFTFTAVSTSAALRFVLNDNNSQTVTCKKYESYDDSLTPGFINDIESLINVETDKLKSWKNKTWLAYGDSITAISNGNSLTTGWAKYVNNEMQFRNFYGRGVGGQTYVWNNTTFQVNPQTGEYVDRGTENDNCLGCFCSWQRISAMIPDSIKNDIDLIWLMGGTNDISNIEETTGQSVIEYTKPVFIENQGTDTAWANAAEYNGGDYDVTTFSGAVASTIMKLQYRCPNALIIVSTPMPRWYTDTFHPTTTQQTEKFQNGEHNGVTTTDTADVEIKVARYMSVPYYDTTAMSGVNGFNWDRYMTGVHPYPVNGQKMLARTIIGALKGFVPIIN